MNSATDLKSKISSIIDAHPKHWGNYISRDLELMKVIQPIIDQYQLSVQGAVYCYLNNTTPICPKGNTKKFTWFKQGFVFCGTRDKCKCNSDSAVAKSKETNISKYGVDSYAKTEEFKAKSTKTNLEKFGVEHASQSPAVRSRAKQTCIERYGVEYPSKLTEFTQKAKDTRLRKYNDENYSNPKKREQTLLEKYGVTNFSYAAMSPETKDILLNKEKFVNFVTGKTRQFAALELNVDANTIVKYITLYNCAEVLVASKSKWEEAICSLLDSLSVKYIQNTKKIIPPFELDFYIPDFGIAIECHGNYWHSEKNGKGRTYHFNKWKQCLDKGISLFQFFEDELEFSWPVVESKIKYLTHQINKSIGARRIKLRTVSFEEESEFLCKYHLQKETKARSYTLGGFYNDQLCAVLSVVNRASYLEVIRYATNTDAVYPGLFSKMLSQVVKDLQYRGDIVSFSDNRHSTGNLYKQAGFKMVNLQGPAYWYTKDYITRENRQRYMKSKIKKKFRVDVENKTEFQLMYDLKYDKIWDAGKRKWLLTIK
jgi:G:T-mismatch repair DNA endonuclease (very short patch repair protein)